jgi:predicted RNA binding protein YcfA (HicA-like mRNA interferase family)
MVVVRIRGSHHVLEGGGRRTVVPVHGNQTMKIGTLQSILRDIELSPEDFARAWSE